MKSFMKELSAKLVISIFAAFLFYTLMFLLGWAEGRIGHFSGVSPSFIVVGTGGLATYVGLQVHTLSPKRLFWGVPQMICFLPIGVLFYTNATGIKDLTMPLQEPSAFFIEDLVSIYGCAVVGLMFGCIMSPKAFSKP